jgi:hydroxyacylglutathione hydrolase
MLTDPLKGMSAQATAFFGGRLEMREPREVRELTDGAALDLAGLTLRVDHTPGHTRGSVVFSTPTEEGVEVILAGDTLFAGSIGRTDLPGGDTDEMMRSLARTVLPLDDEVVVLPGHGPETTIGRERATNPFLRGLTAEPRVAPPTRGL